MILDSLDELSERFTEVSLEPVVGDVTLSEGIQARRWTSSYAHLYVADVPPGQTWDWKALLAEIDSKVLAGLRQDELAAGGIVDAHICFLVDDETRQAAFEEIDEKSVRHVARKYWIERDEGGAALLTRLTLLPVSALTKLPGYAGMGIDTADEDWLAQLLQDGPSSTFERFAGTTECGT